jgi:hypothetical protein
MWLGTAYEQGWFGKTNFQEAIRWFRRAAAQGDPDAQNSLGQMYEIGEGVKQNYTLAAKWYRIPAEHVPDLGGAGQGRNNLGLLYLDGLGVPKDYVQAYMWFRLAHVDRNISSAKEQMSSAEIFEAERMAMEWKSLHPDPPEVRRDSEVPAGCPVTKFSVPSFVPPVPYPTQTDGFWLGSEKLWTMLPKNGTWKLGHYKPADTTFRQKLFWWRKDFRGDAQSMLRVTGKRLDSPAPPFITDQHAYASWTDDLEHPFITTGIDIPTVGCWQITGRFKDAELSFVVWVTQ